MGFTYEARLALQKSARHRSGQTTVCASETKTQDSGFEGVEATATDLDTNFCQQAKRRAGGHFGRGTVWRPHWGLTVGRPSSNIFE